LQPLLTTFSQLIIYTTAPPALETMSNSLHADPPPKIVREPNGIQYVTADQLGKGGFAICYRAEQCERNMPTGKTVALKIVKSQMEPQKLAQKVCIQIPDALVTI